MSTRPDHTCDSDIPVIRPGAVRRTVAPSFENPHNELKPTQCLSLWFTPAPRPLFRRRRAGFTLVEALATLVLVAIVMPIAMQAISLATAMAGDASRRAIATSLAEAKIEELLATGDWQDSDLTGEFTETPSGAPYESAQVTDRFVWEAISEEWNDATMQQLTVIITWEHLGKERSVEMATLVAIEEEE